MWQNPATTGIQIDLYTEIDNNPSNAEHYTPRRSLYATGQGEVQRTNASRSVGALHLMPLESGSPARAGLQINDDQRQKQ
jgi:hypothetical protein